MCFRSYPGRVAKFFFNSCVYNFSMHTSKSASREAHLAAMLTCDVIVYNISDTPETVSEASWAVEALHEQLTNFASLKVFICVSTVLTWARSKPVDPASNRASWIALFNDPDFLSICGRRI